MANITVTRTGTVPTVTLDTPNPATLINGDVFTETGYILDATNPTYDLFADGYNADVIARDTALQTALDAGEVTVDVNGTAITTGAKVAELGTGNTLADLDNQNLSAVLTEGNTTGANDIIVDTAQKIEFGAGSGVSMQQDGADETLNVTTKYGMIIDATDAIGLTDIGGTYLAVTEPSTGNSLQIDSTGSTQITWTQNFGAGSLLLKPTTLTTSRTQFFQDAPGTIALTANIDNATLATKAGIESAGFSGSPLTKAVVFSTAFADADYSVSIIGSDARSWTVDSQTAAGFTINTNSSTALTGDVSWTAIKHGETS